MFSVYSLHCAVHEIREILALLTAILLCSFTMKMVTHAYRFYRTLALLTGWPD